jgi:hypothetical protein
MPIVRIDLDTESFGRLADSAIAECRPVPWQAEVLLKRALGISTPCPLPRVTVKAPKAAQSQGVPHGRES